MTRISRISSGVGLSSVKTNIPVNLNVKQSSAISMMCLPMFSFPVSIFVKTFGTRNFPVFI